jgi:hypothetical protein
VASMGNVPYLSWYMMSIGPRPYQYILKDAIFATKIAFQDRLQPTKHHTTTAY